MSFECPTFAGWEPCGSWTLSATRAPFTGLTNPNLTERSSNVIGQPEPQPHYSYVACPDRTNEMLRVAGSCVVELENNVLLHMLHVNTVGNQKFSATVFSKHFRKYTQI